MATLASPANLLKYYNSEKHSDITILLQDGTIKAHKLVLSEGSDYCKACFEGGFKKADSASIQLQEDNSHAMRELVGYLYGFQFCGYSEDLLSTWAETLDMFRNFIDIYVVAQKYLVPTLCAEAKDTFCTFLERLVGQETHSETFGQAVEHVYDHAQDEATELREPLAVHFAQHVKDASENSDFRAVLVEFPEFAVDVTSVLVQQKNGSPNAKPDKTKKRKLVRLSIK